MNKDVQQLIEENERLRRQLTQSQDQHAAEVQQFTKSLDAKARDISAAFGQR